MARYRHTAPSHAPLVNDLRISQVYGGGGNTGAPAALYKNDFIDVDASGTVTYFNMSNYLRFVAKQARLKAMPSFDQVGQTAILATTATGDTTSTGAPIYGNYHGGESNLFGTAAQVYSNFIEYAWNHNNGGDAVNATQIDVGLLNTGYTWAGNPKREFLLNQYRMINALPYIGKTDGLHALDNSGNAPCLTPCSRLRHTSGVARLTKRGSARVR